LGDARIWVRLSIDIVLLVLYSIGMVDLSRIPDLASFSCIGLAQSKTLETSTLPTLQTLRFSATSPTLLKIRLILRVKSPSWFFDVAWTALDGYLSSCKSLKQFCVEIHCQLKEDEIWERSAADVCTIFPGLQKVGILQVEINRRASKKILVVW
jgi:hypothetical protein